MGFSVVKLRNVSVGVGGHAHPHQELPAGQVVVVVGEDVRQLLEGLRAVPAWGTQQKMTQWIVKTCSTKQESPITT